MLSAAEASSGNSSILAATGDAQIVAVSKLDDPTAGGLQVAIDFSTAMQSASAQQAANYKISGSSGDNLPIQSAAYSDEGSLHRVVLTVPANTTIAPDVYRVYVIPGMLHSTGGATVGQRVDGLWADVVDENSLTPLVPQGDGSFAAGSGCFLGFPEPTQVLAGDFSGNGRADLIAVSNQARRSGAQTLALLTQNQDGAYADAEAMPLNDGYVAKNALAVDWNHDGHLDLVVQAFDYSQDDSQSGGHGGPPERLYVLLNDGHAHFADAPRTPIQIPPNNHDLLAVYDLDGDGQDEIFETGAPDGSYPDKIDVIGNDPFLGYSLRRQIPSGLVSGLQFADMNGDGKTDIILSNDYRLGNYQDATVSVLWARPDGYSAPDPILEPIKTGWSGTGHFTSSGRIEAVTVYDDYSLYFGEANGDVIQIATNEGDGDFETPDPLVLHRRDVQGAAFGDVNNDGMTDVVLLIEPSPNGFIDFPAHVSQPSLWTYLCDGHGGFYPSTPKPVPLSAADEDTNSLVKLVDLDGDGFLDALLTNEQAGELRLAVNDGGGTMLPFGPVYPNVGTYTSDGTSLYESGSSESLVWDDFNRDGSPDFAYRSGAFPFGDVTIYLGRTDGTFRAASALTRPSEGISHLAAGDLNGDGAADLCVVDENESELLTYLSSGDGTFRTSPIKANYGTGNKIAGVTMADVNNDGHLDAVGFLRDVGYGVFFGDGRGQLSFNANTIVSTRILPSAPYGLYGQEAAPRLGDFNSDGRIDLLVQTSSGFSVYLGGGTGAFAPGSDIAADTTDMLLLTGDVNNDGKLDAVDVTTTTASIYLGDGKGGMAPPIPADLEASAPDGQVTPRGAIGDFDGDGNIDLAVSYFTHYGSSATPANIFRGDGAGHFTLTSSIQASAVANGVASLTRSPPGLVGAGNFTVAGQAIRADDIHVQTAMGVPLPIAVLTHATSVDGAPLTISAVGKPAHGVVHVNNGGTYDNWGDDSVVYTPTGDFAGSDSFLVSISNRGGKTATMTVDVVVGQPVAGTLVDDIYVLNATSRSTADAKNGLLANDAPTGGLSVVAGMATGYNGGDFDFRFDGSFVYTPGFYFPGFDYTTYSARGAAGQETMATVTVLSQTAGVVWKFYEQVLHRAPDYAGLQGWINDFAHGGQPGDIAAGFFESTELLNQVISGYYEKYLARAAQGDDLDFWGRAWRVNGGPEIIKAQFASSPEFNALAKQQYGAYPDGWITALYQRILNRAPEPGALPFWEKQLANGITEGQVTLEFFTGPEADSDDVTGWFDEYLGRAPTAAELTQYVNQMLGGASDRAIEQAITNLPEYSANPPSSPPATAARLPDYYPRNTATKTQAFIAATDAVFAKHT